jgi:hypothetical protein
MLEDVMVRRLKDDLRQIVGGFPKREVVQVTIDNLPEDAPELRLTALLDQYRRLREQRLTAESRRTQTASGLLICGLQQRLFSSIEAFARTLRVHRRTLRRQWEAAQVAAPPPFRAGLLTQSVGADDDRALLSEEDLAAEEEQEIEAVSAATVGPTTGELFAREQVLLDEMSELAETSRALPDARVRKFIEWIREHMCPGLHTPGAAWNNTRVIVFTEYDDTKRYLHQQLGGAIAGTDRAEERIAIFHGPTPLDEREAIKTAFDTDPAKHPLRILIATDAAREGLNLQAHCWNLFHFDVPWNPSRMEQRNGRIDRKLQPNSEVFCHYFFYAQRPEDRILAALVRKTKTIREELGSLAQVIDGRLDALMKGGIRRGQIDALEQDIEAADLEKDKRETVEEELEANRERQVELRKQVDRLRTMLADSQKAIGLTEDQFRSAVSCALEILGADPLKPGPNGKSGPQSLVFPALDQRAGADQSWAETMDSLRAPRPRDQKFWEWRRSSPIRPVVLEDPGVVTEDVVQLHLEHRVVQRLLSRFMAQGFVHHDLSRACMAQSSDSIPRVLLLGRLALYGPGAARLHEELIPVTARWIDPMVRKGALSPYGREAETRTVSLLDAALLEKRARPVPEVVIDQLKQATPRDVSELLPILEARAAEYAKDAIARLAKRADAEAEAMREILETQRKHLEDTVMRHDRGDQFVLDFNERNAASSNRTGATGVSGWSTSTGSSRPSRIGFGTCTKCEQLALSLWGSSISGRWRGKQWPKILESSHTRNGLVTFSRRAWSSPFRRCSMRVLS